MLHGKKPWPGAIAEILESKWMKDYPVLYMALATHNLWPSQKVGIARAMKIMQARDVCFLPIPQVAEKQNLLLH